jgi:hypothetical protein
LIDPAFGHWLAGFVDGEGCFQVSRNTSGRRFRCAYYCRLTIALREDDDGILNEIQRQTGVGNVDGDRKRRQRRWVVTDRDGVRVVRDIFRVYPLRAKKSRDFALWDEGVTLWTAKRRYRDLEYAARMEEIRCELMAVKKLEGPAIPFAQRRPKPERLALFAGEVAERVRAMDDLQEAAR